MPANTITISRATSADADAVNECAQLAYQHYVDRMGKKPAPMQVDVNRLVKEGCLYIAKVNSDLHSDLNGKFVGFVIHYKQGDCEHLENIAVLPAFQGTGIGKQIIQQVENDCREKGLTRIELYTNELMHENIAMYSHLGYTETERKKQDGFSRVFFSKNINA